MESMNSFGNKKNLIIFTKRVLSNSIMLLSFIDESVLFNISLSLLASYIDNFIKKFWP